MTKPYLTIFICFSFFVLGCLNTERPIESIPSSDNISKCSFSKLKDVTINKETKNGQEITVRGAIEANVDILKKKFGQFEIGVEDNIALNRTIETINERVTYDQKFRSNHDAIVQILCSLEGDLEKDDLGVERKKKLLDDYDEMRRKYFRYLIGEGVGNTKKNKVEPEKNKTDIHQIAKKVKKSRDIHLKSVYVVSNTEMKGTYLSIPEFKDIRISSEYQQIKIPVNTPLEILYLYDTHGNKWQSMPRDNKLIFSTNNLMTTNE